MDERWPGGYRNAQGAPTTVRFLKSRIEKD
jgi:hypothetical protein